MFAEEYEIQDGDFTLMWYIHRVTINSRKISEITLDILCGDKINNDVPKVLTTNNIAKKFIKVLRKKNLTKIQKFFKEIQKLNV